MTKQRIVVVLGMHRSGTSAIARGLKALDVELGDNLMPGAPDNNERGFWEDMDIYRFNERLLAKIGSAWNRMAPLDGERLRREDFSAERYEATYLLEGKFSASKVFGFKDPRTSVLLPFWKCIFDDLDLDDRYVIAVRNPLEVTESLRKRDNLEATLGLMLWLKYNWAAVENTEGRQRVCVSYRKLMEQPAAELERISQAIDLVTPAPSTPALYEYVNEFLSPSLRHNRISDNEIQRASNVPGAISGLYELLLEWSAGKASGEVPAKLKAKVNNYIAVSGPLLQFGDALQKKNAACDKGRREISATLQQANGKLADREQRVAALEAAETSLHSDAAALRDQLEAAAAQISDREQRIAALEAAETSLHSDAAALRDQLKAAAAQISDREQRVAALEAAETSLHSDAAALRDQLEAAAAQISDREQRVAALEAAEIALRREVQRLDNDRQLIGGQLTDCIKRVRELEAASEGLRLSLADKAKLLGSALNQIDEVNYASGVAAGNAAQQIAKLKADVESGKRALADARSMNEKKEAEIANQRQQLEKQKIESRQATQNLSALESMKSKLKLTEAALTRSEEIVRGKLSDLSHLQNTAKSAQESLAALRCELAEKIKTVRLLKHEVRVLRSSTSWKVTKPFRAVRILLTHPRQLLISQDDNGQSKPTAAQSQLLLPPGKTD
jgi:hypothetical protein